MIFRLHGMMKDGHYVLTARAAQLMADSDAEVGAWRSYEFENGITIECVRTKTGVTACPVPTQGAA